MRPHANNSFSYKTVHPRIREVLETRSILNNTTQVGMPFIKATTTLALENVLGSGNVGFTLGIHATQLDISYQDIYSSIDGDFLVGYTYGPSTTEPSKIVNKFVYTKTNAEATKVNRILDLGDELFTSDSNNLLSISSNTNSLSITTPPPPAITDIKIGRYKDGRVGKADLSIFIPTLWHLEFLHKTFLVPGVGMVVEWGQAFAPKARQYQFNNSVGEGGIGLGSEDFESYMFPWYGPNAYGETKEQIFNRLARSEIGTQEILEKYVYPTQGQYQWLFGRVANFSVKSSGRGSYTCTVQITGPGEDSWAYNIINTVTPFTKKDSLICIDDANSVSSYFTKTSGPNTFLGVLEMTESGGQTELEPWRQHVYRLPKQVPAESQEESSESPDAPMTNESMLDDNEDAYFITWRYFVNVILNDENFGLRSIFKNANLPDEILKKIAFIRPYADENINITLPVPINDPYENFVGCNKFLLSKDPSVLVIVNSAAVQNAVNDEQRRAAGQTTERFTASGEEGSSETQTVLVNNFFSLTETSQRLLLDNFDFYNSALEVDEQSVGDRDKGLLSTGVWLNHKQIIKSMASAETILEGLQKLLTAMSAATAGYWNLAIDVSEPVGDDGEQGGYIANQSYSYSVIDINYSEASTNAVEQFLEGDTRVHIFNKFIRKSNKLSGLVGSELIDFSVELSLPQRLFSQIATLGISLPEETNVLGTGEDGEESELIPPTISDPNDLVRNLFSITSVARDAQGNSVDLTSVSYKDQVDSLINRQCGARRITRSELGTPGLGVDVNDITLNNSIASLPGPYLQSPFSTALPRNTTTPPLSNTVDFSSISLEAPENVLRDRANELLAAFNDCISSCSGAGSVVNREIGDVIVASSLTDNRKVSELSIREIQERQKNRHIFAVGKYQLIPKTLDDAVKELGINPDDIYNGELQERIGNWLTVGDPLSGGGRVKTKRQNLSDYLRGNSRGDLYKAQLDLAKEFASMPVPAGNSVELSNRRVRPVVAPGDAVSYYAGDAAGNTSRVSAEMVKQILINTRREYETSNTINTLKNFLSQYESADGYDAANVLPIEGGRFYTIRVGTVDYKRAINNLPYLGISSFSRQTISQRNYNFNLNAPGCEDCNNVQRELNSIETELFSRQQLSRVNVLSSQLEAAVRQFKNYTALFPFIEPFPDYMVALIRGSANGVLANAFGAAPGSLSINATLTLPGINGFRLGELFWIDTIPTFYKLYGAFILFALDDTIDSSGWKTVISGKFYYLGSSWKDEMAKKIQAGAIR
jgi:hypothetical protein